MNKNTSTISRIIRSDQAREEMPLQLDFHEALQASRENRERAQERKEEVMHVSTVLTITSLTLLAVAYILVFAATLFDSQWRMSWPHFTYFAALHVLALTSFLLMEKTK